MRQDEELQYHSDRATREFDLGLMASTTPAARAHLELASMHMQRVKELSQAKAFPQPELRGS